jgi:quercetin dioxygenase-like cupin family protein
MTTATKISCEHSETTCAYALHALTEDEVAGAVAHNLSCLVCRRELETLRPVIDSFVSWPADILRPRASLQARLARRITDKAGNVLQLPSPRRWCEPGWERAAPGIDCKLLATDAERQRVSMLVRFAPDTSYTAHTHAWTEEVYLLEGDMRVDERKLLPGDYKCSQPGSRDALIHSETGCTCLVITSTEDRFG